MDKFTLKGTGRAVMTRATRRANRFPRKAFSLGASISIRPNRLVVVHGDALMAVLPMAIEKVREGVLEIRDGDGRLMSPGQLMAFRSGDIVAELKALEDGLREDETDLGTGTEGGEDEGGDEGGTDGETSGTPDGETAPVTETAVDAPGEPTGAPEAPVDVPVVPDASGAPADTTASESTVANAPVEPDAASGAPSERAALLPEDWRGRTKAQLEVIMADLGIPMPEKVNKGTLVSAIEAWI